MTGLHLTSAAVDNAIQGVTTTTAQQNGQVVATGRSSRSKTLFWSLPGLTCAFKRSVSASCSWELVRTAQPKRGQYRWSRTVPTIRARWDDSPQKVMLLVGLVVVQWRVARLMVVALVTVVFVPVGPGQTDEGQPW